MNRRAFVKVAGIGSIGGLLAPSAFATSFFKLPAPGLQLFTFFGKIDNDVKGTMEQIKAAGYVNIESAFSRLGGLYGMKPKEWATMLTDMGMKWRSHHVIGAPFKMPAGAKPPTDANGNPIKIPTMQNLKDNRRELVDMAAEGGVEYLVCANIPISTVDEIKEAVGILNSTNELAKKAGLKFVYHNHDAEFKTVDGVIPYDVFLKDTGIKMELDLAWAVKGGKDPVAMFNQNPGRYPLWHVKDLDATHTNIMPVGKGTINFKPIFDAASKSGLEYYFVEHDMPKDALASIKESMETLKKLM
jgi:hypothetical protein